MHRFQTLAAGLAAVLLTPAAPAAAEDTAICHVGYATKGDAWSFDGEITITNTGTAVINGWTLRFALAAGHTFGSGWEATFTADGQEVTAKSLGYNGTVAPEGQVKVGFHASGDVRGPSPAEFRVNGYRCTATFPPSTTTKR